MMTLYQERKRAREVHDNPPENWRETWNLRQKIGLFPTETAARKHMEKKQESYAFELKVDIHPKDGYVVYYTEEEEHIEVVDFSDDWKYEVVNGDTKLGYQEWLSINRGGVSMSEPIKHSIETPRGTISVQHSPDPTYPGYYVSVNGVALVLVEYDATNDNHAIRVWPHTEPENDYEYLQRIPNDFPKEEDE